MIKLKTLPILRTCGLLVITGFLAGFTPIPLLSWGTSSSLPHVDAPDDDESSNTGTEDKSLDRDVMQKIRTSIQADKSLSGYARHIQIDSNNGEVTLSGPVLSQAESSNIEAKAIDIAGAYNVVNDLAIKSGMTTTRN